MATVTSLGFSITSRWSGDGVRRARRDIRRLGDDAGPANNSLKITASTLNTVAAAAISLTPALIPISGVALGAAAGLTAMGVAAGSALGIYAFAMKGAIAQTLEMDKAHKKLNPSQKAFITSLNGVKTAMNGVTKSTMSMTLKTASIALDGVAAGVAKLTPIVRAVDPIIRSVAESFKRWASGSGMDRFVQVILTQGVPALRNLMQAGKNVVSVLGTGFRAFLPLGRSISAMLLQGSINLKKWADGGGFQRFIAYVRTNGPAVREFFKALGGAVQTLFIAMKPMAPVSLLIATALAKLIAACPPSVVTALAFAFVGLRLAITAMTVIAVITKLVNGFRAAWFLLNIAFAGTPIGLILTGIALLVAAIVLIATKTTWFQTAWKATWNAVKVAGIATWNALKTAFFAFINAMKTAWNAVNNALRAAWRNAWNFIKSTGQAIWGGIRSGFNGFISGIKSAWNSCVNFLKRIWNAGWNAIRNFGRNTWNNIRSLATAFINGVKNVITRGLNALKSFWNASWNGIKRTATTVWNGIKTAAGVFWRAMKGGFDKLVSGIKTTWNKLKGIVAAPVRFFVNTVYGGMRKAWNNTAGKIPGVPDLPAAHVGFANGGRVTGPGGPRQDRVPAMLSAGEYVINARSASRIGHSRLDALNGGKGGATGAKSGQAGFLLGGLIPNPVDLLKQGAGKAGGIFKMLAGVGGDIFSWGKDLVKSVGRNALQIMFKPISAMVKGIAGKFGGSGMAGKFVSNFVGGAIPNMISGAVGKMQDDSSFLAADFAGGFGSGSGKWLPTVLQALKLAGESAKFAPLVLKAIMKESGGNPNAVNNWDSNAKNGTPSGGLLQTIGPTFNAYAGALRSLGMFNPLANVYAAIRYARARYGGGWAARMAAPGGYAAGGLVTNSFDSGGMLPTGLSLAYNGTGKPEPVGHNLVGRGAGIHVSFTNCTFSGSKTEFEDMVVRAVSEAKRKKRL